ENAAGVENIDEIIDEADGIMVARGDMGVEIPMEDVPVIQKKLIRKCYVAGKQVITATQMLDSMQKHPRPTRAEITDVANAIYDGTSAIMLSGETAAGMYPIEAVRTMSRIAMRTESDIDYKKNFSSITTSSFSNVTNAISHATCTTAHDLKAAAIITVTKSGQTARLISRFRPETPIIGCSPEAKTCRHMSMSWGVTPLLIDEMTNTDALLEHAVDVAYKHNYVEYGDLVVITAGLPLGVPGTTNMLKVQLVGNILTTGTGIGGGSVCGTLCVVDRLSDLKEEMAAKFSEGDIIVLPEASADYIDIIRECHGIICERGGVDSYAAIVGQALNIPVIVGATGALKILKSGTTVTLDAAKGIVFSNHIMQ
ncbi:MAG: pyruvate kinase, partial [Eubacteriales bacterium]